MDSERQDEFVENCLGTQVNFKHVSEEGELIYEKNLHMLQKIEVDIEKSQIERMPEGKVGQFPFGAKLYYTADQNNKDGLIISYTYRGYSINIKSFPFQIT